MKILSGNPGLDRRCRDSSLQDIAREMHLDWKTVKALEMQYMREQFRRVGMPGPQVIGIDEISLLMNPMRKVGSLSYLQITKLVTLWLFEKPSNPP